MSQTAHSPFLGRPDLSGTKPSSTNFSLASGRVDRAWSPARNNSLFLVGRRKVRARSLSEWIRLKSARGMVKLSRTSFCLTLAGLLILAGVVATTVGLAAAVRGTAFLLMGAGAAALGAFLAATFLAGAAAGLAALLMVL